MGREHLGRAEQRVFNRTRTGNEGRERKRARALTSGSAARTPFFSFLRSFVVPVKYRIVNNWGVRQD